MANIKTTITTIRRAAHALTLEELNAKLRDQGETPVTQHSLNHARDLGFIQESERNRGKWFTVKAKRAEIDGWSAAPAAPATQGASLTAATTRQSTGRLAAKLAAAPRDWAAYSAVQRGVLMALRSAEHGVKGEDMSINALTRLAELGLVRRDKRDARLSADQARWFVRKDARPIVDGILNGAGSGFTRLARV